MNNGNLESAINSLSKAELAEIAVGLNIKGAEEHPDKARAVIRTMIGNHMELFCSVMKKRERTEILDGLGANNLLESMKTYLSPRGLRVTAATDTGPHKKINEDRVVIDTGKEFYCVIDGMGGHGNGDKAAQLAAEAMLTYPYNPQLAVEEAISLYEKAGLSEASGACFHAIRIRFDDDNPTLEDGQMGDVRLLVVDKNNTVVYESQDENFVDVLVRDKFITPDEALYHPRRSMVLNAISRDNKERKVDRTASALPLKRGYKIILMDDGTTDNLTTEEFLELIQGLNGQGVVCAANDVLQNRMQCHKEIIEKTPDRRTAGIYSDGYKSMPKPDNRAIVVIEMP